MAARVVSSTSRSRREIHAHALSSRVQLLLGASALTILPRPEAAFAESTAAATITDKVRLEFIEQVSAQESRAADMARTAEEAYERWTVQIESKASRAAESARLKEAYEAAVADAKRLQDDALSLEIQAEAASVNALRCDATYPEKEVREW